MPELIAYIDERTIPFLDTWDLSPYFAFGYLLTNNDLAGPLIGSPLTRVLPPDAISGASSWRVNYSPAETVVAEGYINEGTGSLTWPGYFISPAFFTGQSVKNIGLDPVYCKLVVPHWPSSLICWMLTYTGPDGKIAVRRGPNRPPSKFIIPEGSDLSTVKLIEDGLLIPPNRYQIITKG